MEGGEVGVVVVLQGAQGHCLVVGLEREDHAHQVVEALQRLRHLRHPLLGGTENYVVTREFRRMSTREQRGELLQCLYAVAAADGTISSAESAEIVAIGEELGFTRAEANSLRGQYRDKLAEFQTK